MRSHHVNVFFISCWLRAFRQVHEPSQDPIPQPQQSLHERPPIFSLALKPSLGENSSHHVNVFFISCGLRAFRRVHESSQDPISQPQQSLHEGPPIVSPSQKESLEENLLARTPSFLKI
ncbi:hypothetical protein I3760_07G215600 [Carya illinoinensis]|nr:hypothetical protein I3760_07G215600 [Carya illinoinensis]